MANWEWLENDGNWYEYSNADSRKIEKAYSEGSDSVLVLNGRYRVFPQKGKQENTFTKYRRKVRRIQVLDEFSVSNYLFLWGYGLYRDFELVCRDQSVMVMSYWEFNG